MSLVLCGHDSPALKCICHVYGPSQAALKISLLEASGYDVFAPWFHMLVNHQHHAIAFGGLPLLVPRSQAVDALQLLLAVEQADEAARAHPCVPRSMPKSLVWRIVLGVVFWKTATGPSLSVTFLTANRTLPSYATSDKDENSSG